MSEAEAHENNVSYEAPLKATVELTNKVTGEIKEQEIYLGDYPWMTTRGTFIINGAERVVVSQLIRSSGVFFTADQHGTSSLYGAKVIPVRGAWLEFETAANGANNQYVRQFPTLTKDRLTILMLHSTKIQARAQTKP
jgi:DNA-directed RNA polymerase subunit beta